MTTPTSLPRFWPASVRLLQDPIATLAEVRVEAVIASYWHTHGEAFPGIRKLTTMLPLDRRTIQRALRGLEEREYIQTVERHRDDGGDTSNVYLPTGPPAASTPPPGDTDAAPRRHDGRPPGGTDAAPPAVSTPPNLRSRDSRSSESREREHSRAQSMDQANTQDAEPPARSNGAETIGCRNAEWPYAREPIFEDFRLAINRPEWGPSAVDESAGRNAVALLQDIPARAEQFREGHRRAISDGKKHTHLFADTVQELRNGDCSSPKSTEPALFAPTGPAWLKEAREIDPEYFKARGL